MEFFHVNFLLLDPWQYLEVSYKIGPVRSSVDLLPGILSLVFSEFWHGARNPYEVGHGRARFSGKKIFALKFGKMDQKWGKNKVF